MTPDRDTLARDLLTLPALVGAPGEVVRGLPLVHPSGARMVVDSVFDGVAWDCSDGGTWSPAWLADHGWRVDLDAWGSVGPLLGLLPGPVCVVQCDEPGCDAPWMVTCSGAEGEGTTLAEAAARALVEVARA